VILIAALMLALLMIWWRWRAYRVWMEAPEYSMLRQERRFDPVNDPASTRHIGYCVADGIGRDAPNGRR